MSSNALSTVLLCWKMLWNFVSLISRSVNMHFSSLHLFASTMRRNCVFYLSRSWLVGSTSFGIVMLGPSSPSIRVLKLKVGYESSCDVACPFSVACLFGHVRMFGGMYVYDCVCDRGCNRVLGIEFNVPYAGGL
jgi:hypothetical protein